MMGFFRLLAATAICFLVAGCSQTSQTGVSTYGGSKKPVSKKTLQTSETTSALADAKQREAKIEAARERARKARADRKAAFKKAREERIEARKKRREARRAARTKNAKNEKATSKRSAKRKKASTKRLSRKAAKRSGKKRVAKRTRKNIKIGSIKVPKGKSYGITLNDPWRCVPGRLKNVIRTIAKKYGRVVVNSTHRSWAHNRRVGGKPRSYHLKCRAIDFNVYGNTRGLSRWLRRHPHVGGFKRYKSGYFHIDDGPRRTW